MIPDGAVRNKDDYRTTEEDERRLFYVACTRSQKFLRLTHGVDPTEKRAWREPSVFWAKAEQALAEIDPPDPAPERPPLEPEPNRQIAEVSLSFSELKYAFDCPYAFKLRFMYGFNPPIDEALGLGKGLHDCLFELHDRALHGGDTSLDCVDELVERHLHTPFAYPELRENLATAAKRRLRAYLEQRQQTFAEIEHAERPIDALNRTKRSCPTLGAIGLLLEEDNFGAPSARCWPVRTSRSRRVFEICGDDDWRRLTERYPIEVTFGRRGNWDQATGRTGRWLLPDWSLVLQDDDAVPLSAMVYFAASGRVLALERDVAMLIAGWNADETYWLTDVLAFAGAPTDWAAADHHPSRTWHPLKGRVE